MRMVFLVGGPAARLVISANGAPMVIMEAKRSGLLPFPNSSPSSKEGHVCTFDMAITMQLLVYCW
jgi:hypothetical protein